ncbi:methylated-DNA--[protein]-cysteine S-methyltransferase [Pasteurellaceae bacterium LIM206]|nr:methylated-DNA--[protein]-cysteine S-methyltransferase [Pasteurellaceae bacterium LIM206]
MLNGLFHPVTMDNRITKLNNTDSDYFVWLDKQNNPPKSYWRHPITSEQELMEYKKLFQSKYGISLGAYIQIKRVYFLLNNTQGEDKFYFSYLGTPLGTMLAVSSEQGLCLLEFLDRRMLETELMEIIKLRKACFCFEQDYHHELAVQLTNYFNQTQTTFNYPLDMIGTAFQQQVWHALLEIPYGTTACYSEQAEKLNCPTATRAVAAANGKNKISILVPCHRVLQKNGQLGGYGGGIERKRFLLDLESKN